MNRRYGWTIPLLIGAALLALWWLARVPDPTPELNAAQRELNAADASQDAGDFPQAMTHAARARDLYDKLAGPRPDAAQRGLARADFRLGRGYYSYGYPAAAEASLSQAVAGFADLRAAAADDADLHAELLEATDWQANAWDQMGWGQFTPELRVTTAAGWRALAARPDAKPRWLANYGKAMEKEADGLYAVAESATAADRPAAVTACRARYDEAIDHYRRASRAEPANAEFKLRLLESSLSVVELLAVAGDPPGMAVLLPPLESLAAELRAANLGKSLVLRAQLRTRQDRARYHQLTGKPDDLRTAMAIYTELAGECRARIDTFPKQSVWVTGAVEQAQNAGKIAFAIKDWKAARAAFEYAVTTWEAHPDRFPTDQLGTWYLDLVVHLVVAHGELNDQAAGGAVLARGVRFASERGLTDARRVSSEHLVRVDAAVKR